MKSNHTGIPFLRIASAVLAAVTCFLSASCVTGGDRGGQDSGPEDASVSLGRENPIEDVTLDGQVVKFMVRAADKHKDELFVEGDDGSKIDSAVYERELKVEGMLNSKIEYDKVNGENADHGPIDVIRTLVDADDPTYDVFSASFFVTAPWSSQGLFADLKACEHLDLSREYWSQYYNEKAKIGEKIYTCTGSAAISTIRFMFCVYFNKELAAQHQIPDPYEMVLNGEWTLEKELSLTKDIYSDLNHNNTADAKDLYGLGLFNGFMVDGFTSSCDLMMIGRDDNGDPVIEVDAARYQDTLEKVHALIFDSQGTWSETFDVEEFSASLRVFQHSWIYAAEQELMRNMEEEYGIIPFPKYDEHQSEYYSYAEDQVSVFAVPKTSRKTDAAGATLEALAYISHEQVLPVYYEEVLKTRYLAGEKNGNILDGMRANYMLDTAWIYCNFLNDMPQMMRKMTADGKTNFASRFAATKETYAERLEELVNNFKESETS